MLVEYPLGDVVVIDWFNSRPAKLLVTRQILHVAQQNPQDLH